MAGTVQVVVNGTPVEDALYTQLTQLEVEENADLPGAFLMKLPITTDDSGDLTFVNDPRFQPFANIAVVAKQESLPDECVFDGYVLSSKLHLETGGTASVLQVWAQDASWLMNLEEKAKEWVDVTDGNVANSIFSNYGFTPADENTDDDSPSHTEDGHSLMQRGTDIQFLRQLARRNGKLCRVYCDDQPGVRTGLFAKPQIDGDPDFTLALNDSKAATVSALDFEWDVTVPSAVKAQQAIFSDKDPVSGDTTDSGFTPMDEQALADFAGRPNTVMLTTQVDDAGELLMRAQSLLREAGWFARCEGETDANRVKAIFRVGKVVQIDGAGSLNSGKYFVWSVRHTFTQDAHKMRFVLVRNAMGPAPTSAGGALGGVL